MKRWALVNEEGIVENVVEQDDIPEIPGDWKSSEENNAGIGMVFDGTKFDYTQEYKDEFLRKLSTEVPKKITIGAFKDRLGATALALSVSTDPICIAVREILLNRSVIDLGSETIRNYMMLLVTNNLPASNPLFPGSGPLTEERVNEILSTPASSSELP